MQFDINAYFSMIYTLDELESIDFTSVSKQDLIKLKNSLNKEFYHTSINEPSNKKMRIGALASKIHTILFERQQ